MLELWANNVASSVLRVSKRMQQLPTTRNNMQQGVQTGGRNMTVDKGYVYTMPDIFSCRHEKLSVIVGTATATCSHCTKVWHKTHPICEAPLSRSARCSFAPLQKSYQSYVMFVMLCVNRNPIQYDFCVGAKAT